MSGANFGEYGRVRGPKLNASGDRGTIADAAYVVHHVEEPVPVGLLPVEGREMRVSIERCAVGRGEGERIGIVTGAL